jgi:lipoate synthase
MSMCPELTCPVAENAWSTSTADFAVFADVCACPLPPQAAIAAAQASARSGTPVRRTVEVNERGTLDPG